MGKILKEINIINKMVKEKFSSPIEFCRIGLGSKRPSRIFAYIIAGAMTFPLCERAIQNYERDLIQYSHGEISEKPNLSDYSPIGRLKNWFQDDKVS